MCSLICIVFKNIAMVPLTKQFTGINSCNFSPVWHCGIALTHIHEQSSKAGSLDDIIPSLSSVACLRHKEREGASEGRGGAGLRQRLTFVPVKTMLLRHPTAVLTLSLSLSQSPFSNLSLPTRQAPCKPPCRFANRWTFESRKCCYCCVSKGKF